MPGHVYDTPLIGHGVTLGYDKTNATPPGTYLDAGEVTSIDTDFSVGIEEYKRLKDDAVRRMFTIPDMGSLSGKMQCKPGETSNSDCIAALIDPAMWGWQIKLTDGSTITFSGILSKYSPKGIESSTIIEADFEVAIDGVIVFTPPAS